MYLTTGEPVIKGAPVTTEARAIPGASATTEVQNNSAKVLNNYASDSDPVDAEAPAIILIPLEHCLACPVLALHSLESLDGSSLKALLKCYLDLIY